MAILYPLSSDWNSKARPEWSLAAWPSPPLLILSGITILAPLIDGGTTQLPVFLMRTILFAFCLGWILSRRTGDILALRWDHLSGWIVAFLTLAVASVAWTPYTNVAVQWVMTLTMYTVFFQIAYQGIRSFEDVRILVMIVLAMGAFQAVLGIIQSMVFGTYRAHGTFFNANFYSTYQVGVFALAGALLSQPERALLGRKPRAALMSLMLLSLTAFFLARSRGGLLALVPVIAFLAYMRFGKGAIAIVLSCIAAVVLLPNPIRERGLEVAAHDHFAYTRIDMWKNAVDRIIEQPWGSGLGMYKYGSFQSRFPVEGEIARFAKRAESPHNEYLQIAAELGIAGVLIFLAGVAIWLRQARQALAAERPALQRAVATGLVAAVSAILLHACVDSVFHEPALVLQLILSGAMVLAIGQANDGSAPPALSFAYTRGRALIGALALCILLILTIQPAAAWYAFQQGNDAARSKETERSIDWYRGAIMVDPWNAAYHDALAASEFSLFGQSGDRGWILVAVEEMKMCVRLNKLDGRSPFRLGMLYERLADSTEGAEARNQWLAQAHEAYAMAVENDPYSPGNYVALGRLQRVRGDLRQARATFSKAIDYEPNYLPARALRIEVDVELGNRTGARDDYDKLLAIAERWNGKAATTLEQQYLNVDTGGLKRLFPS